VSPSILLRMVAPARRVLVAAVVTFALFGGYGFSVQPAGALTPNATQMAQTVLTMINTQRVAHGMKPLVSNGRLATAAHNHNLVQQRVDKLSHQITPELALIARYAHAGYSASYATENVGATALSLAGLQNLQRSLFASLTGRTRMLSSTYTSVGVNVVLDTARNKVWLTQDYARAKPAVAAPAATVRTMAGAMLAKLNLERTLNGRKAVTMNSALIRSAHTHNLDMASKNTMSHQLPGEPDFTHRIQTAGYNWMNAGENIGWNSDVTTAGVLALETIMYNEKAPNDGHRQNILSSAFHNVGIDVYYDAAHHKMWLTEDFGTLMS
jgi:uncharacterized protein YkwD